MFFSSSMIFHNSFFGEDIYDILSYGTNLPYRMIVLSIVAIYTILFIVSINIAISSSFKSKTGRVISFICLLMFSIILYSVYQKGFYPFPIFIIIHLIILAVPLINTLLLKNKKKKIVYSFIVLLLALFPLIFTFNKINLGVGDEDNSYHQIETIEKCDVLLETSINEAYYIGKAPKGVIYNCISSNQHAKKRYYLLDSDGNITKYFIEKNIDIRR